MNIKVPIKANTSHLHKNDLAALKPLIEAVRLINPIYLEQMKQDPNISKREEFQSSSKAYFYPEDLKREELEEYIKANSEQKEELLNPLSVVKRKEEKLITVPYSEIHKDELEKINKLLKEASNLVTHPQLKEFLKKRAEAFVSNNYKESDTDWVKIENAPIEITIGPFEEYADKLMGVKRDFEGMLGITLKKENEEIHKYQSLAQEFDEYLGKKFGYTPVGKTTPMVVMDEIFSGGSSFFDYVPMAYNLPNDRDIHKLVGSKKVFIKNIMEAKFNKITVPVGKRVLKSNMHDKLDSEIHFLSVVGHELSHGLGFMFNDSGFKELGLPLEEAKADVFGLLFLYFLVEKGEIKKEVADSAVILRMADSLRQLRFDIDEAHAFGSRLQYRWLKKEGLFDFDKDTFVFNLELFQSSLESLGQKLFKLTQLKNYEEIKKFTDKWGGVLDELRPMIAKLDGIPIDIDPVFEY